MKNRKLKTNAENLYKEKEISELSKRDKNLNKIHSQLDLIKEQDELKIEKADYEKKLKI